MPIPLTKKELEYLLELVRRNAALVWELYDSTKTIDQTKLSEPLFKPMPAWERKLRQRLRTKGRSLAHLLGMLSFAGVYPDYRRGIERRVGETAEDVISAWWIVIPQLAKEDFDSETFKILLDVVRKTGLTTEKAAKEAIQVLCLIAERVQRSQQKGY